MVVTMERDRLEMEGGEPTDVARQAEQTHTRAASVMAG